MLTVIGSFVSPYVRKVLACLELKGLDYEVDPITPFYGNDEFTRLSPLRRIPVLIDGDFHCSDSSVVCAYLDEAYGGYPLLPEGPRDRAKARWLEEFADTRLGDVFIWGLFYQKFVRPRVWEEEPDHARVDRVLAEDVPCVLDYLEGELPAEGYAFGQLGLADLAIATFFVNARYAGFDVDAARWPRVAGFVAAVIAEPVMQKLLGFEAIQLNASIKGRRQALMDAGVRLTAESWGLKEPRRGMMAL
ncbi:glutathione S-transferase family protein [Sphingomonas alba]|uniref:Glutathione S-transferase family protein n=1 Tax=Sphingomonas alba TaxID=2908208 RepID=A0ABT0RKV6_9SPHN|nr:glutathione S-transferase family protein [Sphingomonas alba]MCL6683203.1 glutathione S-transferase family protein [Sphingomonas alba]